MVARKRALFIDRDGVLNEVVEQEGVASGPRQWDQVVLNSELDRLPELKPHFELILVTNQPDLERKKVDPKFVEAFHARLLERFGLDAIYCCPFSSNAHPLKKPNPGMFFLARKERGIDLGRSFHLGDSARDVGAAEAAGIPLLLWDRPYNRGIHVTQRITSFSALLSAVGLK